MKSLINIALIIVTCKLSILYASTTLSPSRSSNQEYNEILTNTDRFISTIEHKLNRLVKTEINAIRQEFKRLDQSETIDKVIKNYEVLKNSIDSIKDECQIFDVATKNGSKSKIDNLQLSVLALRQSTHRIEKELAIIKKSKITDTKADQLSHPVMFSSNNLHDHEKACTSSDQHTESGIRKIRRDFFAYCEMTQDDGNWIVVLTRFDGSINFFRNWQEYKQGFGNIAGEYWMGLDKIYELTSSKLHELMIVVEDFNGIKKTAKYSAFGISSEAMGYALNLLGSYSGDAGDCLSYHAGMKFSTIDVDNDEWTDGSCSKSHFGAWWYNKCDQSNLNGLYYNYGNIPDQHTDLQGMHWKYDKHAATILKSVKMMIRPVQLTD
ncbi:hypothetical protein ACKWTF_003077 [Chironomus riparius]